MEKFRTALNKALELLAGPPCLVPPSFPVSAAT